MSIVGAFVGKYYQLSNLTLSKFWHKRVNSEIVGPEMTLVSFKNGLGAWNSQDSTYELSKLETESKSYVLGPDNLGPITTNNGKEANILLLQNLVSATISISLISLNVGVMGAVPYEWRVTAVRRRKKRIVFDNEKNFDFVTGGGAALFKVVS